MPDDEPKTPAEPEGQTPQEPTPSQQPSQPETARPEAPKPAPPDPIVITEGEKPDNLKIG